MNSYRFGNLVISGLPRWEAEAVYHATEGRSSKEAAREMGISYHTVQEAWKRAAMRAGARNQRHLIATGFIQGWIRKAGDAVVCLVVCIAVALASAHDGHAWPRRGPTRRGRDEYAALITTETTLVWGPPCL